VTPCWASVRHADRAPEAGIRPRAGLLIRRTFYIYSASKPFVALLVHLLAERGRLDLDDPVAAHWPQFDQHGNGSITVRHALQHRAGIPITGGLLGTLAHMHDWALMIDGRACSGPRRIRRGLIRRVVSRRAQTRMSSRIPDTPLQRLAGVASSSSICRPICAIAR